eukprot:jgi/Ulvmu1/12672/UM094_0028.1
MLRHSSALGASRAVQRDQTRIHRYVRVAAGTTSFQPRDILPVPIKIMTIGKPLRGPTQDLADEWGAKVKRYVDLENTKLKGNPKRTSNAEVQKIAEGQQLLAAIDGQDFVVALDERGQQYTSHDFAHLIAKAGDQCSRRLVFCVGGAHGLAPEVRERANAVVSLSCCVLNHQIANIMLLEQLYRAYTIIRGEPYHH